MFKFFLLPAGQSYTTPICCDNHSSLLTVPVQIAVWFLVTPHSDRFLFQARVCLSCLQGLRHHDYLGAIESLVHRIQYSIQSGDSLPSEGHERVSPWLWNHCPSTLCTTHRQPASQRASTTKTRLKGQDGVLTSRVHVPSRFGTMSGIRNAGVALHSIIPSDLLQDLRRIAAPQILVPKREALARGHKVPVSYKL